jgi:hypothetical protein
MVAPARVLGATLAVVLLSGCGAQWLWDEPVPRAPSSTPATQAPATPTPSPDDRTLHPYAGTLGAHASCVTLSTDDLAFLEEVGGVGQAVRFPVGAMVKSNSPWWTVAVSTRVSRDSGGYSAEDHVFFVTSYPTYADDPGHEPFAWRLTETSGDAAAAKALACAKKLPVPAEAPAPGSPDSYTGKLAAHATCRVVPATLLDRLEDVGQVGGAVTYPKGRMVRANAKWWTVAVATQVNPNGEGLNSGNVPATALFVTNAPEVGSRAQVVSFPIEAGRSDAAARKALACLNA